ncbi:RNA 2',3'-cyclic phosphodiesterase [Candidatus Woesearchaeota archaeon CG10_big_fil_rev_8_21_14_0_10_32_9]|nr:MAG: RNA 2',3'-cyclic phosphodiesterase [Candidatus Woesearchaeota archaeon CG10_big_fil_rev_8_21_14_0_10_32_9]
MRCFVAIPLPKDLKDSFQKFNSFFSTISGLKFVHPDNMHLTLFFLRDVKDINSLVEHLRKINFNSFKLNTLSLDVFKNEEDLRALWVGVNNSEELFSLWAELNKIFCQERPFLPHITFARVKNLTTEDKQLLLQKLKDASIKKASFSVDSFKLYSSELTSLGPVHRVIESFPLK